MEHLRFNYGLLEGHTVYYTVYLWSVRRLYGLFTARQQAIWFNYGPLEGCTVYYIVYLWSVRRLYGLFTARQQAIRFNYGQLRAPFGRQPRGYLRKEFPMYFCILWFYFYIFLLCFMVLSKQLQRLYTGGSIFKYRQYIITVPIIWRNFLYIFIFYIFISYIFSLYFFSFIKAITEAVYRWFRFSSITSV